MANLPPPNHVVDLPKDDPEEQPKLAPEPNHLNRFALHQNPQPEGNMNGWILEDDEEEEKEEDPEMEEEMEEENNDNDAEVINPYEEADPLKLPPPDSDTESEDMAVAPTPDDHEQEAGADTIGTITRVPYFVRPFSGTFYVGSGPSQQVFAPGPTGRDVNTLHHQVKGLTQQMGQHALKQSVCTLEDQVRELVQGDREENKKLKTMLEFTQRDFDRLSWHYYSLRQWSFEVQWHLHPFRHYRERPYVAPTAPVAPVARTDPDELGAGGGGWGSVGVGWLEGVGGECGTRGGWMVAGKGDGVGGISSFGFVVVVLLGSRDVYVAFSLCLSFAWDFVFVGVRSVLGVDWCSRVVCDGLFVW
ncbi:hypothetical protein Tco_0180055 [Tanacetum coccineum]